MVQSHPVTLSIHKTCTFMLLAGFELAVLLSERPQTYAFESSATGTCNYIPSRHVNKWFDGWGGGGKEGGGGGYRGGLCTQFFDSIKEFGFV